MKWKLYVNKDQASIDVLTMIQHIPDLSTKLASVSYRYFSSGPTLENGKSKITNASKITEILIGKTNKVETQRRVPTRVEKFMKSTPDYDDRVYSEIYSDDGIKSQIQDEDDYDEEIKSRKKEQYDKKYNEQLQRLEKKQVPKRVPVEQTPDYAETTEEKKEDEMYDYFKKLLAN